MSHETKARTAWGEELPDWVLVLAQEADRTSQGKAAAKVGYSPATVSYVLGNRYTGDLGAVSAKVEAALMNGKITCPEMGEMSLAQCLEWRDRAGTFAPTSSLRRVMFEACNACPHHGGRHNVD
ncbi:hypothetical protein [Phenylobacterium sp.]|uniref:hypothetical protein n=1 Tax=Phenylobacterium sp. TaxID=1871053 RepID=UPI0019AA745B|nr:hypothetical protein [Phenylobacterium sp.]MBC7168709.1 hypothetical protein [Phenylobacterium sp.]